MTAYLGHRSRAAWNVSLWLNNDRRLYEMATYLNGCAMSRTRRASVMLASLPRQTPDGFRYTFKSVRDALDGMRD